SGIVADGLEGGGFLKDLDNHRMVLGLFHCPEQLAECLFELALGTDILREQGIKLGHYSGIQPLLPVEDVGMPGQLVDVVARPAEFGTDGIKFSQDLLHVDRYCRSTAEHPFANELHAVHSGSLLYADQLREFL